MGAVARDSDGHLAAATSTGGMQGKLPGRVGDSPLLGAGTYASDRSCAVSGTGVGAGVLTTTGVGAGVEGGADSLLIR